MEFFDQKKISVCVFLFFTGFYNASLDGEDLQAEITEEQDPRKGQKVKIGGSNFDFESFHFLCEKCVLLMGSTVDFFRVPGRL